jgi:hypothetical protein
MKAGNGTRTRDPNLGKVVLYQLSYSREEAGWRTSLQVTLLIRRPDPLGSTTVRRQSTAIPTMEARGIEPLTS